MDAAGRGAEPTLYDALALAAEAADELVLRSARDTHHAVASRVHRLLRRPTRGASDVPGLAHLAIAAGVYGSVGVGLRAASAAFGRAADARLGPPLERGPRGRFLRSAVNGLIGDRLAARRPRLAIDLAVRVDGADVEPAREALAAAYPAATPRVVVFLHGLSEHESHWERHRDRVGATYAETLAAAGWTPVMLRANTGLAVRENGAALAALLERLAGEWPVGVERLALVGHSMGGLVVRAACALSVGRPWADVVSDVVTLGTPHLGAPLAARVGDGAALLARLPETAAFGRVLDWRSAGVHDLVEGLGEDTSPLPHARYRLVSATLTRDPGHPAGRVLGDLLVRVPSASGRARGGRRLFPDADLLHLPSSDHFDLLNHPRVHEALARWLA